MKKTLIIALLFVLIASLLGGCGTGQEQAQAKYKDGTYEESTGPDERGWVKNIAVTIENDKITKVVYDEINDETKVSKADNEAYIEKWRGAVPNINPRDVYDTLAKELVEKQDVEQVDVYTGATDSTGIFKDLAKQALEKAENK